MKIAKTWICDDVEHIKEMVEYYKPKLGISDWAIEVVVKPIVDIHNQGVAASHWLLSRRAAWTTFSRHDSRGENTMPDDAEQSLVHELLHIVFAAWHDSSDPSLPSDGVEYRVCCEQPIDQLAETLVLLRRSSGHKFSFEKGTE